MDDANQLAAIFKEQGFEVTQMTDESPDELKPTRDNLNRVIYKELPNKLQAKDRLVIYFSGHGQRIYNEPFFMPSNGRQGETHKAFPMETLRKHTCLTVKQRQEHLFEDEKEAAANLKACQEKLAALPAQ